MITGPPKAHSLDLEEGGSFAMADLTVARTTPDSRVQSYILSSGTSRASSTARYSKFV